MSGLGFDDPLLDPLDHFRANHGFIVHAAQMIGGPKASILSCAEPLSSALLSLALLGISFTLPDWLGTLLILSSVALISLDSRRKVRPA